MAQLNFDASRVQPSTGFDPVPAGWYKAMIEESEMKPTKDGTGAYLNLRFTIIDGPYKDRKIFSILNIQNSNSQAVEIAYKNLSAIAHAIGVLQVADSQQLHNQPMNIKVKLRKPENDQFEEQNVITQWKNINEQVGVVNQPAAPMQSAHYAPQPTGAPAAPNPGQWQQPPQPFAAPAQQPAQPAQQPQPWAQPPQGAPTQPWAQPAPAQPWAQPAPAQAAPQQPPTPPAAPAPWTPPNGGTPWQQQPPAAPAQAAAPAAPAQPPHPAQVATPPWQRPAG